MAYKPKPFQRPRIELDNSPREWGYWLVTLLRKGDVIPDVGKVESIEHITQRRLDPEGIQLILKIKNVVGVEHTLEFAVDSVSLVSDEEPIPAIWAFH